MRIVDLLLFDNIFTLDCLLHDETLQPLPIDCQSHNICKTQICGSMLSLCGRLGMVTDWGSCRNSQGSAQEYIGYEKYLHTEYTNDF